jgi:hypothetical protein
MPVVILFFFWIAFLGVIQVIRPDDRRSDKVLLSGVLNTYLEEKQFANVVASSTGRGDFERGVIEYVSRGDHLRCVHGEPPERVAMQEFLFVRPGNNVVLVNATPALLNTKVEDPVAVQLSNGGDVYQVPSRRALTLIPQVLQLMSERPPAQLM